MKKNKKVVNLGIVSIAALLLVANVPAFKTEVSAATTENVTSKVPEILSESTQHRLDKYVTVENNQYVLNEAAKSVVSEKEYEAAKQVIVQTNASITKSGSVINKETKEATNEFTVSENGRKVISLNRAKAKKKKYHYGVNKVTYHWNYIRIYMDKKLTKAVVSGVIGGLGALVGEYVTGGAATVAIAVITPAVASYVGDSIKSGVWVDYNLFIRRVNRVGWQ
ncbi:Putative uncharacterized protein yrbG [Lactobacillus equicursoris DSM 19284 = JCM 14600 = CIP 110162]|nr:hypothetical protein [Lactobacillus equicursoris]CCK82891.1 Putative uncharacterized protein yrbG [Lactobacillus equicursoris 66c]CCK85122.1 Putative uncharacterized protein yrbG [Lactobacillus equicursoris DSM 19284 = JCM 14600 = CIP 110162]